LALCGTGGTVGGRRLLEQCVNRDELVQNRDGKFRRQLLALRGGIGFCAGQNLIQFTLLDVKTFSFDDDRVAKQRLHRRFGRGFCVSRGSGRFSRGGGGNHTGHQRGGQDQF
jgi:hypothetical protein